MSDPDAFNDLEAEEESTEGGPPSPSLIGALFWVAVVSGLIWISATAYVQIRIHVSGDQLFGSEGAADVFRWAQTLGTIAYPFFLVSVGLNVLWWLRGD
jgi:hypothetical protein